MASIAALVQHLGYQPTSVGHRSACLQPDGPVLPSTVSMTSPTVVCSLSEEIFALHAPLVVTMEPHSPTIRPIELATDRSASTWKAHFDTRTAHHLHRLGMASDRGLGLVAGSRDACPEALWVGDHLQAFQDLYDVRLPWENKAYGAIAKADEAIRPLHHAQSASTLNKRLTQYAQAPQACAHAMARYDQRARRLQLLQAA